MIPAGGGLLRTERSNRAQPSPENPVFPPAVGTQDSPILQGKKPQDIPAPVPTQPKHQRVLPWWEADWAKVARTTEFKKVQMEVLRDDLKARPRRGEVEGMNFSNVIDMDPAQNTLQGRMLRVMTSQRSGEPQLHRYVTKSHKGFPPVKLRDVAKQIDAEYDRAAVASQFDVTLGAVEEYGDVRTYYR